MKGVQSVWRIICPCWSRQQMPLNQDCSVLSSFTRLCEGWVKKCMCITEKDFGRERREVSEFWPKGLLPVKLTHTHTSCNIYIYWLIYNCIAMNFQCICERYHNVGLSLAANARRDARHSTLGQTYWMVIFWYESLFTHACPSCYHKSVCYSTKVMFLMACRFNSRLSSSNRRFRRMQNC